MRERPSHLREHGVGAAHRVTAPRGASHNTVPIHWPALELQEGGKHLLTRGVFLLFTGVDDHHTMVFWPELSCCFLEASGGPAVNKLMRRPQTSH